MELSKLLKGIKHEVKGEPQNITGLSYDSRDIKPGDLFIAIKGLQADGHDYAEEAAAQGAAAVLTERPLDVGVPQIIVANTRRTLGLISARFYGEPGKKLKLLGITGTNGKTTSAYWAKSILENAGFKVGLIGTIEIIIGDVRLETARTTPESLDLQKILAKMQAAGMEYVVMEISSHALALHRTVGLQFAGALFTNLSQDHLDFHAGLTEYFQAKAKLFAKAASAAVNIDDVWGLKLQSLCTCPVAAYGIKNAADFRAEKITLESSGVSYILTSGVDQIPVALKLSGGFNVYNSLGAAALCAGQGVSLPTIRQGLEALAGVPGRFERIQNDRGLNVVVDYAHTPEGLANLLAAGRQLTRGRVILVFGAGGDRDKSKRPLMGKAAAQGADYVIITSDNPRSEDPGEICSHIVAGFPAGFSQGDYEIIADRRAAIRRAVALAGPADLVLIAGKGHESVQESAGRRIHFDDREEARIAIKELKD
ncbi:MAG TPA: UDP-N-acetylmuramoyl-L-alanyl-D-glutamate--2,6-diaminopimelate ligase [Firmicutes bacterium]|nr:UDP-N-acetylmuramoyl-L-alanyl-D-glutamate--2,6-diaminopimelate ligase [Bacillota bacterium]